VNALQVRCIKALGHHALADEFYAVMHESWSIEEWALLVVAANAAML
jgi:hypothetical protein